MANCNHKSLSKNPNLDYVLVNRLGEGIHQAYLEN